MLIRLLNSMSRLPTQPGTVGGVSFAMPQWDKNKIIVSLIQKGQKFKQGALKIKRKRVI